MSDVDGAADVGSAEETYAQVSTGHEGEFNSASDAARALSEHRQKQREPEQNAAPETISGEAPEVSEPAETPSLDPPRSWTKEDKETFKTLPRETQERLVEIDRARELEIRNGQNEIAQQRRAAQEEALRAQQLRQQYENQLPWLQQMVLQQGQGEFADIQSMADVERLSREDWPRYVQWDAHQKKVAAIQQQQQYAQQRQYQERQQAWQYFIAEQDRKFKELAPEFNDVKKIPELQKQAVDYLKGVGLTEAEIVQGYNTNPVFRDARMQKIIHDAAQLSAAVAKAKTAAKPNLPPVQRPGVAATKGERNSSDMQALTSKLERSGKIDDAVAVLVARRKAARA